MILGDVNGREKGPHLERVHVCAQQIVATVALAPSAGAQSVAAMQSATT
jgi:hypothetical protein